LQCNIFRPKKVIVFYNRIVFLDEMAKNEVRRSSNILKIKSKIQHDELLKKTISELNLIQPKKRLAEPSSMKKLISGVFLI